VAILKRTTTHRYIVYLSRNLDHRGIDHPTAYRPVPVWLQYALESHRFYRARVSRS